MNKPLRYGCKCHAERLRRLEDLALLFSNCVTMSVMELIATYQISGSPQEWALQQIKSALRREVGDEASD